MVRKPGKKGSAEERLLRLAAWFIDQGEPVTREQVYDAFPDDYAGSPAAREKMFTRDKDALERLGYAVRFVEEAGPAGGAYVVDRSACYLPRLELAPEEAAVVWLAGQAALRNHDHPLRDDLEVALRKLVVGAKGLPPRAAPLDIDAPVADPGRASEWLATIVAAVEERKRLRLRYRRLGGEETDRQVDPYGYAWRRGEWIFVGHCHLRRALRLFHLRRVLALERAPAQLRGPDYEVPEDFDIRAWSRQEPWEYLAHEPVEAVVRFRGSLAAVAPKLLPRARLSTEPDNSRVARLAVRNLGGLVRQALAWGPEAEILEPARGREMAREILAALAGRLGGRAA